MQLVLLQALSYGVRAASMRQSNASLLETVAKSELGQTWHEVMASGYWFILCLDI